MALNVGGGVTIISGGEGGTVVTDNSSLQGTGLAADKVRVKNLGIRTQHLGNEAVTFEKFQTGPAGEFLQFGTGGGLESGAVEVSGGDGLDQAAVQGLIDMAVFGLLDEPAVLLLVNAAIEFSWPFQSYEHGVTWFIGDALEHQTFTVQLDSDVVGARDNWGWVVSALIDVESRVQHPLTTDSVARVVVEAPDGTKLGEHEFPVVAGPYVQLYFPSIIVPPGVDVLYGRFEYVSGDVMEARELRVRLWAFPVVPAVSPEAPVVSLSGFDREIARVTFNPLLVAGFPVIDWTVNPQNLGTSGAGDGSDSGGNGRFARIDPPVPLDAGQVLRLVLHGELFSWATANLTCVMVFSLVHLREGVGIIGPVSGMEIGVTGSASQNNQWHPIGVSLDHRWTLANDILAGDRLEVRIEFYKLNFNQSGLPSSHFNLVDALGSLTTYTGRNFSRWAGAGASGALFLVEG